MNLRELLIRVFLTETFTYRNFINLLRNRKLLNFQLPLERQIIKYGSLDNKKIDKFLKNFDKITFDPDINYLTIIDKDYPMRLLESYEPPIVLCYMGKLSLLHSKCLGVVGGRVYPNNVEPVLTNLIQEFVKNNITIISGLAKGIDTIALTDAIKNNGQVIAVIGTGLKQYYPRSNYKLQKFIANDHLLISEYPPNMSAQRFHFPQRNRIIAALNHGTLIVSARERSGSLITGNLSLENNREVFALPGEINDEFYKGTNKLIQAGAKLVLKAEDIIDELNYY